jgi:hypothetical protein
MIPTEEQFMDLCYDYYWETDHDKIAKDLWKRFGYSFDENSKLADEILFRIMWIRGN